MPFHLQCPGCGSSAYVDCTCPPGAAATMGAHGPQCAMADLDAHLNCRPGSSCCLLDHHHGQAANACPGGHGECAVGDSCEVMTPAGEPCPGGHCGLGQPGCTVCRPMIIAGMPGSSQIQLAAAGG